MTNQNVLARLEKKRKEKTDDSLRHKFDNQRDRQGLFYLKKMLMALGEESAMFQSKGGVFRPMCARTGAARREEKVSETARTNTYGCRVLDLWRGLMRMEKLSVI